MSVAALSSYYLVILWRIGVDGMQNLDRRSVAVVCKFMKRQYSLCPDCWICVNLYDDGTFLF